VQVFFPLYVSSMELVSIRPGRRKEFFMQGDKSLNAGFRREGTKALTAGFRGGKLGFGVKSMLNMGKGSCKLTNGKSRLLFAS